MFRPLRRKKRAITDEEARELLATCKRGVFAVNGDDGYPYAIPVNYFFDAEHDKIYFHGAKAGHKVDALKRDDKVCFTVYGNEWYQDGDWAPHVMSTVVFGRCRLANDTPAFIEDKVRQLALKYYPSAEEVEEEIAKDIKGVQLKIEWGSQIRSYVFMPYTLAKDHRTGFENGNIQAVMDGDIDGFINAYLSMNADKETK